jgi:hypothetical protein
MLETFATTYCM